VFIKKRREEEDARLFRDRKRGLWGRNRRTNILLGKKKGEKKFQKGLKKEEISYSLR